MPRALLRKVTALGCCFLNADGTAGSRLDPPLVSTDTSLESGLSEDYAIPPDAFSGCETSSIDSSMPSLLMRVSSYADNSMGKIPQPSYPSIQRTTESLEKSGHLAKLGGKLKTWRKRWFVLKNGILTYWKSQVKFAEHV